ncbi:MAG: asparagine synthase C-terminal domain-containing protein [Spirochaetaceae bacterium]|nr:asparagine synthase C-terminal domain-containing protein [Spirochaetaceae bacterium]
MVDKIYAMSSFLQFRTVYDLSIRFSETIELPRRADVSFSANRTPINTSDELYEFIKSFVERESAGGKTALALSGGIDSAICAAFMPKGSVAYTFRCVVSDKEVIDETTKARQFCDIYGLEQRIVEIFWEDYERYSPILMKRKKAPIHSIEVQIYKAALQAKKDGFEKIIFGEPADLVFGGFDQLLSKEYTFGDFVERYSCVMPYKALKEFVVITEPFKKWANDGYINVHGFLDNHLFWEDINSYTNACEAADIKYSGAYMGLVHYPLDIKRIREGESKYLVRELFKRLYPKVEIPKKIPMPRPMAEWLESWNGPKRYEFWPCCHINMTGDQKYYIWILEKFINEFNI